MFPLEQEGFFACLRFMSEHDPKYTAADALRTRGATQSGESNDKIPGFDPAAAPMETDGEAGGAAASPVDPAMPVGEAVRPSDTSYATAMRPPDGVARARSGWMTPLLAYGPFLLIAIGALVIAAGFMI